MILDDWSGVPDPLLPDGYSFRLFHEGDALAWAEIETLAGEFSNIEAALARFEQEFMPHVDEMKLRCWFLVNPQGRLVGTINAWRGDTLGELQGRIHWVSIIPQEQGKKLAKPLLSRALHTLAELGHKSAYLTTQTTSWQAVNLYLKFGFKPVVRTEQCAEGWTLMEEQLGRKVMQ
jgi:GNAT superfamily N-acetyltransferase